MPAEPNKFAKREQDIIQAAKKLQRLLTPQTHAHDQRIKGIFKGAKIPDFNLHLAKLIHFILVRGEMREKGFLED